MMILREAIRQHKGFRYMTEQLDIRSGLGRRCLYEMPWLARDEEIAAALGQITEVVERMETREGRDVCEKICIALAQVRDIRGTVKHTAETCVLDDLELFELKHFALVADEIRELTKGWECVRIPRLKTVVCLLDPEKTGIPHFYIYDAYSAELAEIRAKIKLFRQQGKETAEIEQLYVESVRMEDVVREELSVKIREYHQVLWQALEQVALLDILIAKAQQAKAMQLVLPRLGKEDTCFRGLFNPQLQEALLVGGKRFQAVDLELRRGVTLVTGANMAGKTVLLKTVALAQYLMQFGFYVPATDAEIVPVDEIQTSIGDEQDELSGLSSFAAEMLALNRIADLIKSGQRVLVLLDELARTTNPTEGQAIVNGMIDFLTEHATRAIITTHYSGIVAACHKLRVKGFIEEKIQGKVTLKNINEFIDYSLEEDNAVKIPQEAMRIAALLEVDKDFLSKASFYFRKNEKDTEI